MPNDLPEQLRKRALTIPDGKVGVYELGVKLCGVEVLTDGLMVLALAAVEERTTLSGKAQKRLLARLLIDAMGAQVSLSFAEAGKIGARLHTQASKVRAQIAAAVAAALELRRQASASADGDEALSVALPARLEQVAALEQVQLDILRLEQYEGLVEIAGAPVKTQETGSLGAGATQEPPSPLPRWLCGEPPDGHWLIGGAASARLSKTKAVKSLERPVRWPAEFKDCPEYAEIILTALQRAEEELEDARAMAQHEAEYRASVTDVQDAEERENMLALLYRSENGKEELRMEIERAKGREEALQKAVERAYQLALK